MSTPPVEAAARFAEALCRLEDQLRWDALAGEYCDGDAAGFFSVPAREALWETGMLFANDLAEKLRPRGTSLYIGAALFELVPILSEHLVLEREVRWHNLPGPETDELNRALADVSEATGWTLPSIDPVPLATAPAPTCDHVWLVSVLTDPDSFPALHDQLYERRGELATGRGELGPERERALQLVANAISHLTPGGLFATTDEELTLVAEHCTRAGRELHVPEQGRLSGIVGDAVRLCSVD